MSLVSDLVYKRLLSRPGLSIAETPKVFTLGLGDDTEATFLRGSTTNEQTAPDARPQLSQSNHGKRTGSHSHPSEHNATMKATVSNVVNDTNTYLRELHS